MDGADHLAFIFLGLTCLNEGDGVAESHLASGASVQLFQVFQNIPHAPALSSTCQRQSVTKIALDEPRSTELHRTECPELLSCLHWPFCLPVYKGVCLSEYMEALPWEVYTLLYFSLSAFHFQGTCSCVLDVVLSSVTINMCSVPTLLAGDRDLADSHTPLLLITTKLHEDLFRALNS